MKSLCFGAFQQRLSQPDNKYGEKKKKKKKQRETDYKKKPEWIDWLIG